MGGRRGDSAYARQNKRQVRGDDDSTAIMGSEEEFVCTIGFPVVDNGGGGVISNVARPLREIRGTKGACRDGERAGGNYGVWRVNG